MISDLPKTMFLGWVVCFVLILLANALFLLGDLNDVFSLLICGGLWRMMSLWFMEFISSYCSELSVFP